MQQLLIYRCERWASSNQECRTPAIHICHPQRVMVLGEQHRGRLQKPMLELAIALVLRPAPTGNSLVVLILPASGRSLNNSVSCHQMCKPDSLCIERSGLCDRRGWPIFSGAASALSITSRSSGALNGAIA